MSLSEVASQTASSQLPYQQQQQQQQQSSNIADHVRHVTSPRTTIPERTQKDSMDPDDFEAFRYSYISTMIAGGAGGLIGDMIMHSLDTVKTRQQGDPNFPPKYSNLRRSYFQILREEGIMRGLYGGVSPAFLGSFIGTSIFFGSYEWSKRWMIDHGVPASIAYLNAGLVADVAASPLYVPTEVLKTRLQLQGRHNNPFFQSGYNYKGTIHALRSIVRNEGAGALFYGYKATLYRDVPFSALQFLFYEQEQKWARQFMGSSDIGLPLEMLTGATAGCLAGVMTCPLDVVKTRIQTQLHSSPSPLLLSPSKTLPMMHNPAKSTSSNINSKHIPHTSSPPTTTTTSAIPPSSSSSALPSSQARNISTSSPSTTLKKHTTPPLDTSSVMRGLQIMYRNEGMYGLFRGVGPRAVWTAVQSGCMFMLYQTFLKWLGDTTLVEKL